MTRKEFLLVTLGLCLVLSAAGWTQELPTLEAPKVEAAPKIDGDLSDPCWQQAARASNFYLYDKLQPASVQTEALICYDDQALYVGFKCPEPALDKLVASQRPDDTSVHQDDSVELFLSTGTDGRTYYHFIVSALNARTDQWNRVSPKLMRTAWDADWKSAVRKGKDAWTVEMAIPWYNFASDIGNRHIYNRKWRINFCRNKRTPPLELSTWAFVRGNFHLPDRFGILTAPQVDFSWLEGIAVHDLAVPDYRVEDGGYFYMVKGLVKNDREKPRTVVLEAEDRPVQGEGSRTKTTLDLAPERGTPFELKLTMADLGDRRVTIRLMDSESKQVVHIANLGVAAFPQLMKGYLDRNYYSFEKQAHAIAMLNIPKSDAKFTAKLEIRPKDGKPLTARTSVRDPKRTVITIPLRSVPLGTHPVLLSMIDAKGNIIAKEEMELRREKPAPPPIREVKADRDRMIALVDGKPFFPLGIYGVPPSQMKRLRDAGFNCTIFWGGQGGAARGIEEMTPEEGRGLLRRYLDAAQEAGLMVIEWPPNYAKDSLSYGDPKLPEKMDHFLKIRLPKVIEAQRDHPALLAYYSLDEPGGDYLRGAVAEESRITREVDPYHPNYVLFCVAIQEWPECMDIAGLDWYPRFGQDRVIKCLEGAQNAVRTARRLRVPTWHVPLCETSSGSVRPGLFGAEQRVQTYLCLIGGVNGIVWWVWPPRYQENWEELKKLAQEINAMTPALTTAIPDQSVAHQPRELDDSVQAAIRVTEDGKVHLITCNASENPARATFKLDGSFAGKAEVLFENRQVEVKNSTITDRFVSYGTHVYVLKGTWPEGGTIAINVALEKQKQEGKEEKPGEETQVNLITDSGFEGEGYWVFAGAKGELTDKTSHQGKRCAVIGNAGTWTGWTAKLEPYTRYLFGCYGRAEMSGGAETGLYLQGPYPSGEYVRGATTTKFRDRSPGWDRYIITFTTRDQPLVVRPVCFMQGGQGTAWFDDVFLVRSSEPAESLNLLRNSSFEEDAIPYWPKNWGTGTSLAAIVGPKDALWGPDDQVAYDGKRSLRIIQREWTEETYRQGASLFVGQGGLHWKEGQPYTISVYLKADHPKTKVWLWIGWHNLKTVYVDTEWKRYVFTAAPKATTSRGFVRVSMQSAGTLWVDAAQFEKGEQASPYQGSD